MSWFLDRLRRSPKTTLAGLAAIISILVAAIDGTGNLLDPATIGAIAAGIGLIVAGDDSTLPPAAPGDGDGPAKGLRLVKRNEDKIDHLRRRRTAAA